MSAIAALALAPGAAGYLAQDCTPEPTHLYVLVDSDDVHDTTGLLYSVTSLLGPPTNDVIVGPGLFGGVDDRALRTEAEQLPPGIPGGLAAVADSNVLGDCNWDGAPGDFDGDLDVGIAGFFFGSGTTWDAAYDCGYGYNVHAITGTVVDAAGLDFIVNVGVDDSWVGPFPPVFDPVTGEEIQGCQTDGVIAVYSLDGAPSWDGDCLQAFDSPSGSARYTAPCGGVGGDDGYWGFPECRTEVGGSSVGQSCTLAGTATADS